MKTTPTLSAITPQYLEDREWFRKKYEREIGKISTRNGASIDEVEEFLKRHEKFRCSKEIYTYKEYVESPRPENIPNVVWNGPRIKGCRCPMKECDCRGNILLPPQPLPYELRRTWRPTYYLRALTCHKWQPPEPEKNFAERFQEFVDAEIHTYKKLKEIGALEKRGAEFCVHRCFLYHSTEEKKDYEYFTLKQQILEAYKNRMPPVIEQLPEEAPVKEDDGPVIDGFYRSLSTQSNTDPNGEFIMGKTSHILFANMNDTILCDIDGKELNISTYKESEEIPESQTIRSKLDKLLSLKGIKSEISKFATNFFSSLIEIKDTGIPVISQGTQDPPLDHCYQSIKEIPLEGYTKDNQHADTCPCCRFYQMTALGVISNVLEQNSSTDDNNINTRVSNTDPKPILNSAMNQSPSDVNNEKTSDGFITRESDKLSSSPSNILQPIDSLGIRIDEGEQNRNETKRLIEENENIDNKLSSKSQSDDKNNIVKMDQHIDESRLNNQTNNLEIIDQSVEDTFHDAMKALHSDNFSLCNEKKPENALPSVANIENKVVETKGIAENRLLNQGNEIKVDINENKNDVRQEIKSSSITNINNGIKDKSEEVEQSNKLTIKNIVNVSHSNVNFSEENQANSNLKTVLKTSATCKTNIYMILKSGTNLKCNCTQKPSVINFTLKKLGRYELRSKLRKAMSYEHFKVHIKKSFQKTSSAFSAFFNCVDIKNSARIRNSKELSNSNSVSEEENIYENLQDSNKKDSKISEKEMFSLQYNSNLMSDAENSDVSATSPEVREK